MAHDTPASGDRHPDMDYAQHEATYSGFIEMVKWGIIASAVIVVALYCFIEAQQPILGTVLLLLLPVGAVALFIMKSRSD